MDELTALELIARLKEYGIAYTPREDIDALVEHLEKTFVKPRCRTETSSAKKITVDVQLRPLLDDLQVDIDDIKEYINKAETTSCEWCEICERYLDKMVDGSYFVFCPHCGRKLN